MSSSRSAEQANEGDGPGAANLRVRRAQPSDRAFVLGLAVRFGTSRAAWREYDEVVCGTQRQLAKAFDDPQDQDVILIAVDAGNEPIGFAFIVTDVDFFTGEPHGHLSEIAAAVDGIGAGRALIDAAEAWSRGRGFRYLSLNVNDANIAARRIYERRSYVPEYRHLVKFL